MGQNLTQFRSAAKEVLELLPNWQPASMEESAQKRLRKEVGDDVCKSISFVTTCKWIQYVIPTLVLSVLSLILFVIGFLFIVFLRDNKNILIAALIMLAIYIVLCFINNKTLSLFRGARYFDSKFGLHEDAAVRVTPGIKATMYLGLMVTYPYTMFCLVLSGLIGMLSSLFLESDRVGDNLLEIVLSTNRIYIPSGVLGSFDELLDRENYLSAYNVLNRLAEDVEEMEDNRIKENRRQYIDNLKKVDKQINDSRPDLTTQQIYELECARDEAVQKYIDEVGEDEAIKQFKKYH